MPSAGPDAAIIGAVYDAALSGSDPAGLLLTLSGVVDSNSVVLFVADASRGVDAAAHNIPQGDMDRARQHYFHINPFTQVANVVPPMRASRGEDVLPMSRYRKTEFYVDFAAPLDTTEVIGARIPVAAGIEAELCFHRGRRVKIFSAREVARVQRLLPHVQRALQLRLRLPPIGRDIGLAALDVLAESAVILAADGRAVFANRAAMAQAATGDFALGGKVFGLTLAASADQVRLAALVRDAVAGGPGGALMATATDGGRLFVLVSPLPSRFGAMPGHVLAMVRRADARPHIAAGTLRDLFGLTAAEARLAVAIAAGATIPGLTGDWGLSENTLRSQLSAVFGKTGTVSQRDLVALLAAIPGRFGTDGPQG